MVFSLEKYQLSPKCGFTAFLPESLGEYYKAWHDLAAKAVNLVTAGTMRQECLKLPQLDSSSLTEYGELRLAHLQLCIITCGYVWEQGTGAPPVPLLPACVAVPFHDVSKKLGMTPVITHSDVAANWELIDEDGPLTRDNFRVRYMMPGGQEFVDFTTLVVEMDVHYTKILPTLQKMGKTASPKQVAEALQEVTIIARKNRELSAEFKNAISVDTFFHVWAPFLGGFSEQTSYPDGLLFEGVTGSPRIKCRNAAASQTVMYQIFDRILSVDYPPDKKEVMEIWRESWPTEHRAFFDDLPDLIAPVKEMATSGSHPDVTAAYNELFDVVRSFRTLHLTLAQRYTLQPAKKMREALKLTGFDPFSGIYPLLKGIRDGMGSGLSKSAQENGNHKV